MHQGTYDRVHVERTSTGYVLHCNPGRGTGDDVEADTLNVEGHPFAFGGGAGTEVEFGNGDRGQPVTVYTEKSRGGTLARILL